LGRKTLGTEPELVLELCRWLVYGSRDSHLKDSISQKELDWPFFIRLLADHELLSLAYHCFKEYLPLIPPVQGKIIKQSSYLALGRLADFQYEFLRIHDCCIQNRLELVPLKGAAFMVERLFGERTGLRPMSDLDILVRKDDLPRAEKILESLGYRKQFWGLKEDYWMNRHYHLVFEKPAGGNKFFTLELHWLLSYPQAKPLLPLLWKRLRTVDFEGRRINLLSIEDSLFCLALNLRPIGNTLALKSACDFACLLERGRNLDWDYLLREAKIGQMRAVLYFRFIQARLFLGSVFPENFSGSLALPQYRKKAIERFIVKNTFVLSGQEDRERFLRAHFLVYDNLFKPVSMIVNIAQEQFAKFYGLKPYAISTLIFHKLRFLFIPLLAVLSAVRKHKITILKTR